MKAPRIARYFEHQKQKGCSVFGSTVALPYNIVQYARRTSIEGKQISGYQRYDLPLLASYSRSGTNWIRYIIETISGQPTPGQVRVHYGANFVVDRAHQAFPIMSLYPKVILLLRDYRECLLRHHRRLWEHSAGVTSFLEATDAFQPPCWYIGNVAAFDRFADPKLLIYYEDLISTPQSAVWQLSTFLGLHRDRTRGFVEGLDEFRAKSVGSYVDGGHESVTVGEDDPRRHSREHLSRTEAEAFDEYYAQYYPVLFDRYLKRYALRPGGW